MKLLNVLTMIKLKNLLKEVITIDVEIGDTILTGRFKNKKTVVKSIEKDEFGMPTINGRKIVSFRKMPKEKVSENLKVDVARKYGPKGFLIMLNQGGNTATRIFRDKKNFDKLKLNLGNQNDLKKLLYMKRDNKGFIKNENKVYEAPRKPRKKGQPAKSKKHSDLYTDEDPKGTIHGLKFATVQDAKASVSKIKNSGRAHAHKIQAAIAMEQRAKAAGKTTAAGIYRSYINQMKKKTKKRNESVLLERIDFYEVANEVVKKHNLNSQVQFTTSKGSKADYNVDKDVITIKPTNNIKDFFESLLHEIHHAMMAKKLGKKNYVSKYEMQMNLKAGEGKDPYDQNPYEIRAEKYGKKYAPKWMKRLDIN